MKHVTPALALATAAPLVMPRAILGASVRMDANDPAAVLAELRRGVESLRSELSAKGQTDVVATEKIERINTSVGELQAALNDINIKLAASAISGGGSAPIAGADADYLKSFSAYARTGDGEGAIKASQFNGPRAAMSVGSSPDGGLLAPVEWDRTITDRLKLVSAMRGIASVISISGTSFKKLYNDRGTASGWVGETSPRTASANAQFTEVTFATGEIFAMPMATQTLLEDALVNIESWLAGEVDTEFAFQEGTAFVSGNGVDKPKGFLTYTGAGSHPFGAIPTVNTGAAADLTADGFIDLVHDLPSERTPNAAFVMNRKTQGRIRKLKDGQGRYLWEPSTQVGDPATLLGFGIHELPAMPDVAANSIPVAFGDWKRGYLVIDRIGAQILRDPYSNKPYVVFYTRKRVGGGVTDPTCLRYHKVAANA